MKIKEALRQALDELHRLADNQRTISEEDLTDIALVDLVLLDELETILKKQ